MHSKRPNPKQRTRSSAMPKPVQSADNDLQALSIDNNGKSEMEVKKHSVDLQKQDSHLRIIFDNTETAYVLLDTKLNILHFNIMAEKRFTREFGKLLQVNNNIIDYMPDDRKEETQADYCKVLEGEHLNYESNFMAPYGQLIWFNFELSPVVNDQYKILGLVMAITDITKKKKVELVKEKLTEALKASHLGLKKLVAHSQTAREEERLRIAREVHDELGQLLTSTKIDLSMIKKKLSFSKENELIHDEFTHSIDLIDKSIKSVKKIVTDLRPEMLDEIGLVESIRWQVDEFIKNTGITCTLSISKEFEELDCEISLSTTLYRIVQEALTNIKRHAHATMVKIVIKVSIDNIFIVIQDNGVGITEEQKKKKNSFGLTGLKERVLLLNGIIDFTSSIKGGTVIYVQIPYSI